MRRRAVAAVAVLALVGLAAACQVNQTMFAGCAKAADNNPFGADSRYVLVCENGKWKPVMTLEEYVKILQKKPVTIAPVPTEPTTTTIPPLAVDQENFSGLTSNLEMTMSCPASLYRAQVFTAGRTGTMEQVDLLVLTAADLEVSVVNAPLGVPKTSEIGHGEYHGPGSASQLTPVPLSLVAPLTAGVKYAFVVKSTDPCGTGWALRGHTPDSYGGGQLFFDTVGSPVITGVDADLFFRTWVR